MLNIASKVKSFDVYQSVELWILFISYPSRFALFYADTDRKLPCAYGINYCNRIAVGVIFVCIDLLELVRFSLRVACSVGTYIPGISELPLEHRLLRLHGVASLFLSFVCVRACVRLCP